MCWLNRDCCLKWNLWLIPEAKLPYNNLMQPHHARLWSFRFSYIIRISPTQTEVILYCLNNKWAKEQPGLWKSICHLKIDRSCVAWSSKFRGLEIKRVELSDSFLIHSLWAHLYSWASVLPRNSPSYFSQDPRSSRCPVSTSFLPLQVEQALRLVLDSVRKFDKLQRRKWYSSVLHYSAAFRALSKLGPVHVRCWPKRTLL